MIHLKTHLEGISLIVLGVPLTLTIMPPSMPKSTFGNLLTLSAIVLAVKIYAYGIPQTPSVVTTFMIVFEYGILSSKV